jgi:hypothetical protein
MEYIVLLPELTDSNGSMNEVVLALSLTSDLTSPRKPYLPGTRSDDIVDNESEDESIDFRLEE